MKRSSILCFILLCFSATRSYALFINQSVGYEGWHASWLVSEKAIDNAKDEVKWTAQVKDFVNNTQILQKTIEMVNLYNKTKEMTGTIMATIKDVDELGKQIFSDAKNISVINADQLQDIKNYLSWDRELEGRGYNSLLGLSDYYERNTATFRDNNGELNFAQTMLTSASDAEYLRRSRAYRNLRWETGRYSRMSHDKEFRQHMEKAKMYDNLAAKQKAILNLKLFGRNVSDLTQDYNSLFKKNKEDVINGKNTESSSATDAELGAMMAKLTEYMALAQDHRTKAMTIMQEIMKSYNPYAADYVYRTAYAIRNRNNSAPANSNNPGEYHPESNYDDDYNW